MEKISKRRHTLGAVHANRRVTLGGGGGVTVLAAPTDDGGAGGGGGVGNARRASTAAAMPSAATDPRPVSDRSYLQATIRKIVFFLQEQGYDQPPTAKALLRGPSGRDFKNIMTFLLRMVDPTFQANADNVDPRGGNHDTSVMKFEDEVAVAFKVLGYPFPISKTALVAVGAPHTWPALVAAIVWLMEVTGIMHVGDRCGWELDQGDGDDEDSSKEARAAAEALFKNPTLEALEERCEKQIFRFVRKSMIAFMNKDDDLRDDLENQLLKIFEEDEEKMEYHLVELEGEFEKYKEEIDKVTDGGNKLPVFEKGREDYAADIERFFGLAKELKEYKETQAAEVEFEKTKLAQMERNTEEAAARIEGLKAAVGKQELSVKDVRRMEREKDRVEEQIKRVEQTRLERKGELAEAREVFEANYRRLEDVVKAYNSDVARLESIFESAEYAKGERLDVKLAGKSAEESVEALLGNLDVKGNVLPLLEKLASDYAQKTADGKEHLVELRDHIESMQRSAATLMEDIQSVKEMIRTMHATFTKEREVKESALAEKKRRVRLLRTKSTTISDPEAMQASIAEKERQRGELLVVRQKREEEYVAIKKAVGDEIRRALECFDEYRRTTKRKLAQLEMYVNKKQREASNLKLLDSL